MSRRLFICVGALGLACGGSPTARPTTPVSPPDGVAPSAPVLALSVQPGQSVERWQRAASQHITSGECYFAWGNVGAVPPDAQRARIAWDTGGLDGVVLCDAALEDKLKDPRIHQIALVAWDGSDLWASHPSDSGRVKFTPTASPSPERDQRLFAIASAKPEADAARFFNAVAPLPNLLLFAMTPLR